MKKIYRREFGGKYVKGYFIRSSSIYGLFGFVIANLAFTFISNDYPLWIMVVGGISLSLFAVYLIAQDHGLEIDIRDKSMIKEYLDKFLLKNQKRSVDDFFGLEECDFVFLEKDVLFNFYKNCWLEIDKYYYVGDTYDREKVYEISEKLKLYIREFERMGLKQRNST